MKSNLCIEDQIAYICDNEYEFFFTKTNVVGVALGYKLKKGFYTNKKCITVFVTRKLSLSHISKENLIPENYKGIPTDVVESGSFKDYSLSNKIRPVLGGYGIGTLSKKGERRCGTLGCLVTDGKYNYILGNNHILAQLNNLPIGSSIIQPCPRDGGNPSTDVIANLSKYIPIKFKTIISKPDNYADCAIAKVVNNSLVSSEIALVGRPKGIILPKPSESVKKVGRSSELTTGVVTGINSTQILTQGGKAVIYKNQIITNAMAEEGDSGAILLDKNNYVMGLCLGGSSGYTIFSPIRYILEKLQVSIVTC